MDSQMQSLTEGAKVDRTLTIKCTPTLNFISSTPPYNIEATMVYEETDSQPNMPNAVNPQTGDIDIHAMPANSNYTDNIDLYLTLDTSNCKLPDGTQVTATWANVGQGSEPGMGPAWFIAMPPPVNYTPIPTPDGFSIDRESDTLVVIDDNTPDTSTSYAFCLAINLPDFSDYFISFEPIISDKGTSRPPAFMLKD